MTSVWGPSTWIFFHTIAEKIKEESFPVVGVQLFSFIKRICHFLPCPDCTGHAKKFLGTITPNSFKTKENLINYLYIFHNNVNIRKNKPQYSTTDLKKYESSDLINTYNTFVKVYNTKGDLRMLTDTFHRTRLLTEFRQWLMTNIRHFNK